MDYTLLPEPGRLRVMMEGSLTFADTRGFQRLIASMNEGDFEICFNMQRLESIDAAGIDLLMQAVDAAKKNRRRLVLESPQGEVLRALAPVARNNPLVIAA